MQLAIGEMPAFGVQAPPSPQQIEAVDASVAPAVFPRRKLASSRCWPSTTELVPTWFPRVGGG